MVEQTTDRRRYPSWGIIAGFALIGLGAFCVGMTAFAIESVGGSWPMWDWAALGSYLIMVAGFMSIITSRTVMDILDQARLEYDEWRSG